ncbi:retrovirus-related pol polyprotein from transposon tnt 1-94 [Lasius niger]|uniref:Retrovirus-related pol polyprotein from transposon tnt 1-94 n=1 Tax=Lasius niger TaxID=67767 RepID=A0A0J7N0S9_LASNI|nr:retrovirus-related pol polyprotein from transposon tnt 1-94 [Lasius niger]
MGHLNVQSLREAIKSGSIQGIDVEDISEDFQCHVCLQGKMCRAPFPKVSERVTAKGQLIHSDVCGPMRVASHGKKQYFTIFIDDFSGWCEVRFISQKNQVISEFESFRALVSTQHGEAIKCLQSDNGREYVNQDFDQLLRKHGILRRLTAPYNPEQNGVAERRNRTLMEMARCLLIQSELPPTFWAKALNTANYIRNRSPTSKLKGRTPYES